uniref:Ectonucleoside triphosphate diphosphohydrolase 4-like n=1 Tax=Saccoglossus kowalevskii TaxID=10224 RepID=A0ABM0LZ05_SACKO|nr:PREDICTED: ectonucleoside triphosphate diphosphohydrolase 4-like [Saccoglossus kowalevskii]
MARMSFPSLPATWHIKLNGYNKKFTVFLLGLCFVGIVALILIVESHKLGMDDSYERYASKYTHAEATDITDPNLFFGIVIDAGSSGTRVFVYFWPRHTGNSNELLQIQQMRDKDRSPVVKKIKPGLSTLAENPSEANVYLRPLLQYAADHIPRMKHQETPLYVLATAGMRMLPESQQNAILDDIRKDVPKEFNFLFAETHTEVITGKEEGVYAWIGINFVLGRFDHTDDDVPIMAVDVPGATNKTPMLRKRTVGVLDMGGGSAQIAYEVPSTEELAKSLLAEFNLGCDTHETEHVYRVYVTTFLGYGANVARERYEKNIVNNTKHGNIVGGTAEKPILDPCLPQEMPDEITDDNGKVYYLKGTGNFAKCRQAVQAQLDLSVPCQKEPCSINGVYQPTMDFLNSEFYGFSEFWYSMEDVLRMGGPYNYYTFTKAAQHFCASKWSLLEEHHKKGLYLKADEHRFKYQCFKSVWMVAILHDGFKFPENYHNLRTASLIHDKEVQWTLGAILFRTRFLPLREMQEGIFQRGYKPPWMRASVVSNQYLLIVCFVVVLAAILLYIGRLRKLGFLSSQLTRVPTMAYFMTEEGQVQEGIAEQKYYGYS